jgi:hypothetical protein
MVRSEKAETTEKTMELEMALAKQNRQTQLTVSNDVLLVLTKVTVF